MKTTPALFRKAILLLCSAATWSVLTCQANAQNAFAPTARTDESCALGTPATIPCVKKWMITDEQLRQAVAVNSLPNHLEKIFSAFTTSDPPAYAAAKKRIDGIIQHANSQSSQMGIALPEMYVSGLTTQAGQTTEGNDYVLLNKDAYRLAVLTDDGAERMKLSISREFAHIRNGDTSPAAIVNQRNNPAAARAAQLRADLEGAGPLGARNPTGATAAIENDMRMELHQLVFFKDNTVSDLDPNRLSDRDYKRISDEHMRVYNNDPHTVAAWDRIEALRKESRLMSEYERTHAVGSHADREAESKWLVAQILPDANRGGQ